MSNMTGAVGDAVTATTDATVGAATATVGATVGAATATVDATVGAAKATGDVVGQAGTFAMDGASGGIGLVMAGVDQTFETLGGKAGFQAVMVGFGATVDTTDAGLEKLFKELDADGSGQIDESEMTKAIRKVFGEDLDAKFVSEMMTSADTNKDGEIDLEEFKTIMRAGPKEKQGTPTLKPKCILGLNGDKPSGKPNDAIAYVAEGAPFFGTQYSPAKFTLTPELKAKGLSEDAWAKICVSLKAGKGTFGFGGGFSKAIGLANDEHFSKIGCVAAYAEYGPGQKAMVVLTKEAASAGRVTY